MNKAHLTAIARKAPSVPMRRLSKAHRLSGRNMLDYGCGKGYDADHYGMDKHDPHYYNRGDLCMADYDVITCNYVLNVIECPKARQSVLDHIKSLLCHGGIAYITVRRDIKTKGYTKRNTYQENITLNLPILWENKQYCTYILSH